MIILRDFHKGQSSSPYTTDGAFAKSAGLDVFSQPGIARINYKPLKKSDNSGGDEVTELIHSFARNPSTYESVGWYSPDNSDINYDDWTAPTNAYSSNDSYTTITGTGEQDYAKFSASVPTGATITGIEVQAEIKINTGTQYANIALTKEGTNFTANRTIKVETSEAYVAVGGRTDMWGTTWTPAQLNSDGFGLKIESLSGTATYSLDHIRVKVYYLANINLIFAAGENGTVYKSTDAGDNWTVLAASKGRYIKVWKGFLFAILDDVMNVYDISDDSWDDNWQPEGASAELDSTSEHFMLVSVNDGNLYICNHEHIASISEDTIFDPDDVDSYSYTSDHMTVQKPFRAICLSEQREYLLIGAIQGLSSDPKVSSTIFGWDRGADEIAFTVFLSGEFITSMINVQNRIFVSTDLYGKVYSFSESGLTFIKQIPFDYDNNKHIRIGHKGHSGIVFWRDKIVLGVSSEDGLAPAGIYGLSGKAINCEHLISTGEDGSNDDVLIGALYPFDGDTLLYGYYDKENEKCGIDKIKTSYNRGTGYASYFESAFYTLGSKLRRTFFNRVEVQLSRALQSGEGVRIKYRRDISTAWGDAITLGTRDYSTDGAQTSLHFDGIKNIENLQLKVELTTGASSTNTPYLLSITLI